MYQLITSTKSCILKKLILVLLFCVCISSCTPYEIQKPENSSESIEVKKDPLFDSNIISDKDSEVRLFSYDDVPHAQPILVKKIDDNHWVVVLEKTTKSPSSDVKVEQISEDEFRLTMNRNNK